MLESVMPFPIKKFCDAWAESFSRYLASLGVAVSSADVSDPVSVQAPTAPDFENLVCVRFTVAGGIQGELLWVADKPAALQLCQLLKTEPPDPAEVFGEMQRERFTEFVRNVASETASAWKAGSGVEIEFSFQAAVEPASVTAQSATLRLRGEKLTEVSLRLFLDAELCAALSPLAAPAELPNQNAKATTVPPPTPRTTPLPSNLALVLDVELEATIRFGERQMLLRDIFGLMAGAVVELDQMVNEPAELLVAGRLVARGEVVVVDGNFGLRVTEVASVNERVAAINLQKEG